MIKVLGIGSPFGNDSVGWQVADALKDEIIRYPTIQPICSIESHDRPGIRLLELMQDAECVFLVDAVMSDDPAGTIHRLDKQAIQKSKWLYSTHDIGIAQTLAIGEALGKLPEKIILYGIEIASEPLEQVITQVVQLLIDEIQRHPR